MQDILLLLLTTECTYLLLLIIDGSMISHIWVPNHLHAQVVDDVAMLLLHHVLILSWDVWAELLFSLSQVKVKFHVIDDEDMLGSEHTTSWFTV